jgi:hypothetical protein
MLSPKQKKMDINNNGKLDADDLKLVNHRNKL